MKSVKRLFFIFVIAALVMACSNEEVGPDQGMLAVKFQSSGSNSFGNASVRVNDSAGVEITDFRISIRDVAFKSNNESTDTSSTVIFEGPYQLDLLNESDALSQSIGETKVPDGMYKEIRFVMHKAKEVESSSPLYERSVFLKGSINGVPFEMWHDTNEKLDVGKDTGVEVKGNKAELVVSFSLDQFLNSKYQIDLTQARDGNNDGLIEINPKGDDGNKELADMLKENIKMAAKLFEDKK